MLEKPLAESVRPERPQAYRVLVEVRPYNAPLVVRLSVSKDGVGELVAKIGRDGGHPQILTVNKSGDVSRVAVEKFLRLLEGADFWHMPTRQALDIHHVVMGEPGWMLEGSKEGRYHLVHRGASELGPLKDSVVFLVITLAKLDLRSLPVGPAAP
jgi:hypothetical protein